MSPHLLILTRLVALTCRAKDSESSRLQSLAEHGGCQTARPDQEGILFLLPSLKGVQKCTQGK